MQHFSIKPCGMFHTPADYREIENWINKHTPEERVHLHTVMGMTHNLLAKAAKDHICTQQQISQKLITWPAIVAVKVAQV